MLAAIIAGTGMAASAAMSVATGVTQKQTANAAVENAQEASAASHDASKKVVHTLAPAVTGIGDSVQQINERLDRARAQQSKVLQDINLPLVDAVDDTSSQVQGISDKLGSMEGQVSDIQGRMRAFERERQARVQHDAARASEDAKQFSDVRDQIAAKQADSGAHYMRILQDIGALQQKLALSEREAEARETSIAKKLAMTKEERDKEELQRIQQERSKAQQAVEEAIAQAERDRTAASVAAAKRAKEAAERAARIESEFEKQFKASAAQSAKLEDKLQTLNKQITEQAAADARAATEAALAAKKAEEHRAAIEARRVEAEKEETRLLEEQRKAIDRARVERQKMEQKLRAIHYNKKSVRCETNSPIKNGVFRMEDGNLRHYPSPAIAASWDTDWGKAPAIDCTGMAQGEKMAHAQSTLPDNYKVVQKGDRAGGDIEKVSSRTLADCAARCNQLGDVCIGFSHSSTDNRCYPKKETGLDTNYRQNGFQFYTHTGRTAATGASGATEPFMNTSFDRLRGNIENVSSRTLVERAARCDELGPRCVGFSHEQFGSRYYPKKIGGLDTKYTSSSNQLHTHNTRA